MMLPGALKYGGLTALAALAVPGELSVFNLSREGEDPGWLEQVYRAANARDHLEFLMEAKPADKVVSWLLR